MPSSLGDSITLRSFAPLPRRTWMTPRALSMSSIRSPATSEALSPAAPCRPCRAGAESEKMTA